MSNTNPTCCGGKRNHRSYDSEARIKTAHGLTVGVSYKVYTLYRSYSVLLLLVPIWGQESVTTVKLDLSQDEDATASELKSEILYTYKIMMFNATFTNISVLLMEESGENHWAAASHWQTLSHNVVWSVDDPLKS